MTFFQPTALEIGNFELFSSGPQNIKLLGSERYPSNDWILLGEFVAENNREIQRFPITVRSYLKFMRVFCYFISNNEKVCFALHLHFFSRVVLYLLFGTVS